jgi:hypothetical protein
MLQKVPVMTSYSTSTVFMLAPQRHGSNKMQSMLAAHHPQLHGPYPPLPRQAFLRIEASLGKHLLEAMTANANLSPRPLTMGGIPIQPHEVRKELESRGLKEDVLGISIALTHLGAKSHGEESARILCKSPDNLDIAEKFHPTFEDTSFIHLIRDPRAVWNSARGTPRGPQTPHAAALKWADYHSRVLELSRTLPLITLKYEDLMLDTETQLKRVCTFLGIPFLAEMLDDHTSEAAQKAATANPGLWGNLAKPVITSRTNAWKIELPTHELDIIENSCAEVMTTFGYERTCAARTLTLEEKSFKPILSDSKATPEPRAAQLDHLKSLQDHPRFVT